MQRDPRISREEKARWTAFEITTPDDLRDLFTWLSEAYQRV